MKTTLFICLLWISGQAAICQTAEQTQKAKNAVRSYLVKNLNDPRSYSPAKWSKLSRIYTTFDNSSMSKVLNDTIEFYNSAKRDLNIELSNIKRGSDKYEADTNYIKYSELVLDIDTVIGVFTNILNKEEARFKPQFYCYYIEHSFRAKNKFNALVLQNFSFSFDKNMQIISVDDEDERNRKYEDLKRSLEEMSQKH